MVWKLLQEKNGICYYIYQNFGKEGVRLPLPEGKVKCLYGDMEKELPASY